MSEPLSSPENHKARKPWRIFSFLISFLRKPWLPFACLIFFLILLTVDVVFLSWIAINERPIPQSTIATNVTPQNSNPPEPQPQTTTKPPKSSQLPPQTPTKPEKPSKLEWLVNPALIALVILLLFIPIFWILSFHRKWIRQEDQDEEHREIYRDDVLAWLTTISMPYLILGFAMLMEFRAVLEDPAAAIGAIAAIMVLYALSLLASFLFLEVRDLKNSFKAEVLDLRNSFKSSMKEANDNFKASMTEANAWYFYSLKLSSANEGQPSPGNSIQNLLSTWAEIYSTENFSRLRRNAVGTLLHTYIEEEAKNAKGSLPLERVPESAWPWKRELTDDCKQEGVSFLITNTGYYANFLDQVTHFLPGASTGGSGVFLATITYVLPPLWWNWQSIHGDAFTYPQFEQFRKTLQSLTGVPTSSPRQARVFRKIIVADDSKGWESNKDRLFSQDHWGEMKKWQFLMGADRQPISSKDDWLPGGYFDRETQSGALIQNLIWTQGKKQTEDPRDKRHAYWVVDDTASTNPNYPLKSVRDYFGELMHPKKSGRTEIIPISHELFKAPLLAEANPGLSGCSELLFFGVCDPVCEDAWSAPEPELALAVLTTMSPSSETMFVTAVWGEDRLTELWQATSKVVKRFPSPLDSIWGPES
jgi:hypothetical protein